MPRTIPSQLRARAQERPNDIATELIGTAPLTYAAWNERSGAVAQGLMGRGVTKGDRVVLPCDTEDWLDYAIAYTGTQKAGAVAVPVSARLGQRHLVWVLAESGAVGVIARTSGASNGETPWTATVADLEAAQGAAPADDVVGADDPAEILYTSGTTGVAKGVVATHANILHTHASVPKPEDRLRTVLHALPPATAVGQGLLLQPLDAAPFTVLTLGRYDDRTFLTTIEERRPSDVVLVPALALSLIRADAASDYDLSSVRVVRTTSAAIAPAALAELDRMFDRAAIVNMYASTESWPARTRIRFDPSHPRSVGRPVGGSSIRIADEAGSTVEAGQVGNVQLRLVGAPQRRYDGDAAATASVFSTEGWVTMGDTGYIDAEGFLYLVDRSADLVISGGLNVSTLEVEAALHDHPSVIEVAAFGVPHPMLGEYVAAAVRLDGEVATADILAFAQDRLGEQKAPRKVYTVADFPRNAVGKILKRELRAQLSAEGGTRGGNSRALFTSTERLVARLWCDSLDINEVRREDDFLDLGGTSLSAMEIVARLREELGIKLSQRELFDAGTLVKFASKVDEAPPAPPDDSSPIKAVPRRSSAV